MMRRRPIARMAVRTTAVVGTAAVVGGHMANKQAQAAQAQAAQAPAPRAAIRSGPRGGRARSDRAADQAGRSEGLGCAYRSRVRSREGEDSRVEVLTGTRRQTWASRGAAGLSSSSPGGEKNDARDVAPRGRVRCQCKRDRRGPRLPGLVPSLATSRPR